MMRMDKSTEWFALCKLILICLWHRLNRFSNQSISLNKCVFLWRVLLKVDYVKVTEYVKDATCRLERMYMVFALDGWCA